jgi:Ca-activated chloride channel family protein
MPRVPPAHKAINFGMSARCASLRHTWILCALLLSIYADAKHTDAQTKTQPLPSYSLTVSVDEVSLTFHAADAHGLPVNDLKLDELSVLDNGRSPRRIVAFHSLRDFPIRAGILMDTSRSMQEYISRNRAISIEYAQRLLRQRTDQAFVMDFDSQSGVVQPWTSDAVALTAGIRRFSADGQSHAGGTAIFDSIYRACFNQFRTLDSTDSGNFILLFTDGEDNASRTSLDEAVAMCQRTNTAIYIFRAEPETGFSTGSRTLAELASKSGGRVFYDDDSDAAIYSDLQIIEANLRNQYRLVYTPAELKRDGSFHRVELEVPQRVGSIAFRAGYYAPRH